jgi:hypothetical protein
VRLGEIFVDNTYTGSTSFLLNKSTDGDETFDEETSERRFMCALQIIPEHKPGRDHDACPALATLAVHGNGVQGIALMSAAESEEYRYRSKMCRIFFWCRCGLCVEKRLSSKLEMRRRKKSVDIVQSSL